QVFRADTRGGLRSDECRRRWLFILKRSQRGLSRLHLARRVLFGPILTGRSQETPGSGGGNNDETDDEADATGHCAAPRHELSERAKGPNEDPPARNARKATGLTILILPFAPACEKGKIRREARFSANRRGDASMPPGRFSANLGEKTSGLRLASH